MPWSIEEGHYSCPASKPFAVVKTADGTVEKCHMTKAEAQKHMAALYANEPMMHSADDCGCEQHDDHQHFQTRAVDNSAWDGPAAMSSCASTDSPASCYRSICAGRKAGDPAVQASWALPHHRNPGSPPNASAVSAALAALAGGRGGVQGLANREEARRHLEAHRAQISGGTKAANHDHESFRVVPIENYRVVSFEPVAESDGLTLEGYAAVFNTTARIRGLQGEFDEVILPGAFARTLEERMPVLMFEHGRHPLIGSMPLGVIQVAKEDARGLYIRARLTDNWLIQPVRDAVRDGAIDGMSFRFDVPEGGDTWEPRKSDVALRKVREIRPMRELGPVVFPAYEPTTASIRSLLDNLDSNLTGRSDAGSADGGDSSDAQPGNGEASRIIPAAIRVLDVYPLLSKEHYRA